MGRLCTYCGLWQDNSCRVKREFTSIECFRNAELKAKAFSELENLRELNLLPVTTLLLSHVSDNIAEGTTKVSSLEDRLGLRKLDYSEIRDKLEDCLEELNFADVLLHQMSKVLYGDKDTTEEEEQQ